MQRPEWEEKELRGGKMSRSTRKEKRGEERRIAMQAFIEGVCFLALLKQMDSKRQADFQTRASVKNSRDRRKDTGVQ